MLLIKIVRSVIVIISFVIVLYGIASAQSAPSKLELRSEGNSVYLSWQSPELSSNATYNIYRALASDLTMALEPSQLNFSRINTVSAMEYEDKIESTSTEGNLYVYYVAAVYNDGTESAGSNYVNTRVGETKTDKDMNDN